MQQIDLFIVTNYTNCEMSHVVQLIVHFHKVVSAKITYACGGGDIWLHKNGHIEHYCYVVK